MNLTVTATWAAGLLLVVTVWWLIAQAAAGLVP